MKRSEASEINDTAGNSEILTQGTSPTSTGPAGGYFEGQVGASYLLSLLVGAEPRGLSATTIDRVKLQRGAEGHPLDDVIVEAHDAQGNAALLEIQVKRSISFAPSDPVFRDVVSQIAKVASKPEFLKSRYELAIAIAQTSHRIDGPYQTVLTWARQLGDAATFMSRIQRPGSASDTMRTFIQTFQTHLQEFGAAYDDETVWCLLTRLQILPFDFAAIGSASAELAKERATRALHSDETTRAAELWKALTELAIEIASSGGDITRDRLVEKLRQSTFRLAERKQNLTALSALTDASRHALADIGNRVGGAMLTRPERVAAVQAALDEGRYVEIRGDAGVGKSGVLKHFAEQITEQARIIVLNPGRTIPKGWVQLRAVLGFEGTARELLVELAASGGVVLFLDNLDFFGQEERLTAIDLLREAANVPGVSVIATCRRDFGVLEPSWLPSEVLNQLRSPEPVVIDELLETEIEELRSAAPQLRGLLADDHPAQQVSRNLFRLSRLAKQPAQAPGLRTEVDMAKQWWRSADGNGDTDQRRERARVMKALAEQALSRADHLDTTAFPAPAVNALVMSETLRDLGDDRMTFRHDVLRDWAVANLLASDPAVIPRLPLKRPATADLVRGVELAARMTIEGAANSTAWESFIAELSNGEVHGSWRRAAMLSLVRSEIGLQLLDRAKDYLLNTKAQALRELIRFVMAIDVESARKRLLAAGIDPKLVPDSLNFPSGPSWLRLITWLMSLGASLPMAALPEIVDLYTAWSRGTLGRDPITPILLRSIYQWLTEINVGKESGATQKRRPFNGELTSDQIGTLSEDLTTGFLLFCNYTPDLAKAYLETLGKNPDRKRTTQLLKFRGALAQAAPEELAEITAEVLIAEDNDSDHRRSYLRSGPFGYLDSDFSPASPAQGPFLELLVHAPEQGLRLVRRLVDHAVAVKSGGRDFGSNVVNILFLDGNERTFPWTQSYEWSREMGSDSAVVTSALMALEAWAHRRVDAGEPFETVLADVLRPANAPAPAAYLLVAVDLLLSHWPESRTAAIPFLGCPELLCMDRQRIARENVKFPGIFGLNAFQKEPTGLANVASLNARPSRRWMLDQLLGEYAFDDGNRTPVVERLQRAVTRLGPPKDKLGLLSPALMAVHALNRLDPKNYQEKTLQTKDGAVQVWEYISPTSEADHLQSLDDERSRERRTSQSLEIQIRAAFNNQSLSSPALAATAVKWALKSTPPAAEEENGEDWMRKDTVVIAALLGIRDGGAVLIEQHESWMRQTFIAALKSEKDPVWEVRTGIQFNPIAMGFVGMVLLLKHRFTMGDVRTLLEAAGDESSAAAYGFAETASMFAAVDERLPRSILRCALAACVQPRPDWRLPEMEAPARERYHQRIRASIEAELAWLNGNQDESPFPPFPMERPHSRDRYISFRGRRKERIERPPAPEVLTHHHSAALWLNGAGALFDVAKRPWLRDIVKSYASWTRIMNGAEFEEDEELDSPPREWNMAYFKLLAYCLPGLSSEQIEEMAVMPISTATERAFLEILTTFLSNVDAVYFNEHTLAQQQAVYLRTRLAQELMKGRLWKHYTRDRATSTEIHLGPAIAVSFFNEYHSFGQPKCYLLPNGIERVDPFLPILKELVENGTLLLTAVVLLNLLEVAPRTSHFSLIVTTCNVWLAAFGEDTSFWIDQEIGRRLCALIDAVFILDPRLFASDQPWRGDIDRFLEILVRRGSAEAYRLEDTLRAVR